MTVAEDADTNLYFGVSVLDTADADFGLGAFLLLGCDDDIFFFLLCRDDHFFLLLRLGL